MRKIKASELNEKMSGNIDITPTEEEIADLKITPASSEPAEKSEEKIEEEK